MERKKILLVEPPFYRLFKSTYSLDKYPLALGYLAETVRERTQWQPRSYNADFNPRACEELRIAHFSGRGFDAYLRALSDPSDPVWREVEKAIREFNPAMVGISAKSQNFSSACRVARIAKTVDRGITVIMGGPHPSAAAREALAASPETDICVIGEGEETLEEIIAAADSGRSLSRVNGIAYRDNGVIVENPARGFRADCDDLPFPYAHAAQILRDYPRYPRSAFKYIFSSRGCPYRCVFCGSHKVWGRSPRRRTPESVAEEIRALRRRGVRFVHFDDDTFGIDRGYLFAVCDAIRRECPGTRWSCELHARLADEPAVAAMKEAGCYSIQLGIESGSDAVLERAGKEITVDEAMRACRVIRSRGVELQAFFMIGFPWETEASLSDTVKAIGESGADTVLLNLFTPFPGTEAFEYCRARGLIGEGYDSSLYNYYGQKNHFCPQIAPERFRVLAAAIQRLVDRKNASSRLRKTFSPDTLARVFELGPAQSFRKARGLFRF